MQRLFPLLAGLCCAVAALATDESSLPYFEGFEDEESADLVAFWCGGPPTDGNLKKYCDEVTKETSGARIHSGKRSLHLKFTAKTGGYIYWQEALAIPVDQKCVAFTGWVLPQRLPKGATLCLGCNMRAGGTFGGCLCLTAWPGGPEWKLVEGVISRHPFPPAKDATVDADETRIDAWAVFLHGELAGQEIEFYVDDVRLEFAGDRLKRFLAETAQPLEKRLAKAGKKLRAIQFENALAEMGRQGEILEKREAREGATEEIAREWRTLFEVVAEIAQTMTNELKPPTSKSRS